MTAVLQLTDRQSFPLDPAPPTACEQIAEILDGKGITHSAVKHRDGQVYRIHFPDLEQAKRAFVRLRMFFILDYPILSEGATE